jgi:hypothetical protein
MHSSRDIFVAKCGMNIINPGEVERGVTRSINFLILKVFNLLILL